MLVRFKNTLLVCTALLSLTHLTIVHAAASPSSSGASPSGLASDMIDFSILEDQRLVIMHSENEPKKWISAPEVLPPGAEMLVLEGNPANPGPFTMRLKLPPNYQIPMHWHFSDEHITLISGELTIATSENRDTTKPKTLAIGSYARIPAKVHLFASTGNEETIIQLHGVGPWGLSYVEAAQQALKPE